MNRKRLAPLALIASFAIGLPAHGQNAGPAQQLIHLDTHLAAGLRCGWLTPVQRQGLESAVRLSRAMITTFAGPAALTAAEAADREALAAGEAFKCDGPDAARARASVETTAEETADIFLLRASHFAKATEPWAQGVARLKVSPETLDATLAKLEQDNPQRLAQVKAVNPPTMSDMVLAANCKERKGPKAKCPVITVAPADMAYARAWLTETEAFTAAYFAATAPAS